MKFMKQKKRQKLCHNCEGEVDLDVIFCPFCGADLLEEQPEEEVLKEEFVPPYQPKSSLMEAVEEEKVKEEGRKEQIFPPIALLSLGVWFFLLGFFLFLFGNDGRLVLRLNATIWFVYLLLSFPFLFLGYRFLKKLKM
jgi:hypothetical protein